MQTVPKAENQSLKNIDIVSRYKRFENDGIDPPLPLLSYPELINNFMEIGPVVSNGMGVRPLTWSDIKDWQDLTGIELLPWEARLIKRISTEYLIMAREAEKPSCPAPWIQEIEDRHDREAIARQIKAAFKAIMNSNKHMRKEAMKKTRGNKRKLTKNRLQAR